MTKFQNIKTKRPGMRCKIRVMNHSGDDCLTTYDPAVDGSAAVATADLQEFMDSCIAEYGERFTKHSLVMGKRHGEVDFDVVLPYTEISRPDFSLDKFEEILIQPVPLGGG